MSHYYKPSHSSKNLERLIVSSVRHLSRSQRDSSDLGLHHSSRRTVLHQTLPNSSSARLSATKGQSFAKPPSKPSKWCMNTRNCLPQTSPERQNHSQDLPLGLEGGARQAWGATISVSQWKTCPIPSKVRIIFVRLYMRWPNGSGALNGSAESNFRNTRNYRYGLLNGLSELWSSV